MRYPRTSSLAIALLVFYAATSVSPSVAQTVPWDVFSDRLSPSVCDVVNAVTTAGDAIVRTELVVLFDPVLNVAQLVLVDGPDVILADTVVDDENFVFFEGLPFGLIDFAEDGDGFRTLWWISTVTGTVVHLDNFTTEPTDTDILPSEFFDVPCDACPFWDDPTVCSDAILPPISINFCGMNIPLTLSLTALGLALMRLTRPRIV